MAGSITSVVAECAFYAQDTLNMRAKIKRNHKNMLKRTLQKHGIRKLFAGMSCTFYGALFYGFTYFSIYKTFKDRYRGFFEQHNILPILYLLAAAAGELLGLFIYYPYEMIKTRFQAANA